MKNPEDYLGLSYHFRIRHDRSEDGLEGWVIDVEELPGCVSQGSTPSEAMANIKDAMLSWISVALEDGDAIPLPYEDPEYSGRFLVRLPTSLHGELVRLAERENVSLNQFVTAALAGAVSWRSLGDSAVQFGGLVRKQVHNISESHVLLFRESGFDLRGGRLRDVFSGRGSGDEPA